VSANDIPLTSIHIVVAGLVLRLASMAQIPGPQYEHRMQRCVVRVCVCRAGGQGGEAVARRRGPARRHQDQPLPKTYVF
jgi:hypothetical protein